jgi:hypothetical protein
MKSILNYPLSLLLIFCIFSCKTTNVEPETIEGVSSPPDCLLKSFSTSYKAQALGKTGNGGANYIYNKSGKVIENTYTKYQENIDNLGSNEKPYITGYNSEFNFFVNYYCDKSKRIIREDYYGSITNKYPSSKTYQEYNNKNYHIKSTYKKVNEQTGELTDEYVITEAEYSEGNCTKIYKTEKTNISQTKRFLYTDYQAGKVSVKTKVIYLFNYGINSFGNNNKLYPDKITYYRSDGTIEKDGIYVYEFDNKGYFLSSWIKYSDGSEQRKYDYIYDCK